jgi:hypothetical protein
MARFQFNLHGIVVNRRAAAALVSQRTLHALQRDDAQESPQGPGWFDSSWELTQGLDVCEDLPGDAPLQEWLSAVAQRDEQPGARLVPAAPHGAFGHALQLGDLDFGVAAEVAHLDEFSEFGIDGLELM